ncbi:MAG: pilus assembly protein TadG-related protein, partial [Phycisphaerae bacterium]|nr:pilus assembly protein TadG-related protein [Phycisphaerae bacterium]
MFTRIRRAWSDGRRGAVVVFVAVVSTLMAGFTALTIDLGNMYIVKTELQRSADAAALAAASRLARYQAGLSEVSARSEAR